LCRESYESDDARETTHKKEIMFTLYSHEKDGNLKVIDIEKPLPEAEILPLANK